MASIRERQLKNGTTRYVVLWRDPDTKKQTSHPFDSRAQAEKFSADLKKYNHRLDDLLEAASKRAGTGETIRQIIEQHITQLDGVERTTIAKNRAMAEKHIYPTLGDIQLSKLQRSDVVEWINQLTVSPKTAKNIHAVLSAALKTAVMAGKAEKNVAYGVKPPKPIYDPSAVSFEPVFLSTAEIERIIEHMPSKFQALTIALAYTGMRYGEASALMGKDITISEQGRIIFHIRRAWKITSGKDSSYLGAPKTRQSFRSITLSQQQSARLLPLLGKPGQDDFLFTIAGEWIPHWIYRKQAWAPAVAAAELFKSPRIHDLRHSHASALLRSGVPMHVVSRRLGHSSISTTVDKYGHLLTNDDADAADLLDSVG